MTTIIPFAGPLTVNGAPPMSPTTIPPITAEIRPESTGAPEAMAIPTDSGSAIRKTTIDAGTSYRRTERSC